MNFICNSCLDYCILGVAGRLLENFGKQIIYIYIYIFFFFMQGRIWNGYCQFLALSHDLVLRSCQAGRQVRRARAEWCAIGTACMRARPRPRLEKERSRPPFGVTTWTCRVGIVKSFWCFDLAEAELVGLSCDITS